MISEILTACLSATDNNGMFTIEGAFCRLTVPIMPAILNRLDVAIRMRSTAAEDGMHSLILSLTNLDGKLLGPPAESTFDTSTRENEVCTWTSIVITIRDICIQEPNEYFISLQIDGQSIASTVVYVNNR
jgi:hypothetical protein